MKYGYILEFNGYKHQGYRAACDQFQIFLMYLIVEQDLNTKKISIRGRITPYSDTIVPPVKPIDIRIYAYDSAKHIDRQLIIFGAEVDENWNFKARAIDKTRWE